MELETKLASLYGTENTPAIAKRLVNILEDFRRRVAKLPPRIRAQIERETKISQQDIALYIYPNSIEDRTAALRPLKVLLEFIKRYGIARIIRILHILPFYPWDIDRGFSIKDYYRVDPRYGTWKDIARLGGAARLMFDFVINHISIYNPVAQAALIERALRSDDPRYSHYARYKDFLITFSDEERPTKETLRKLARPRATPVLTRYSVLEKDGKLRAILGKPLKEKVLDTGWVWTTFSRPKNPDGSEATRQVDLNFRNPEVLLEVIRTLLFYIERGASFIRLDAIGYVWKKLGSSSLHEREAHLILQIIKDVLSAVAPGVMTIAEVNEPQDEVFRYLGKKGEKEADLVYQLTHFPLAVHAILTEDGSYYMEWLKSLAPAEGRQFITVLGSHDGMGLKPVRGFLPPKEIERMVHILIEEHASLPNYAVLPGGERIVYEVCATPWHLINSPTSSEPFDVQLKRYLAVLALGLMPRGIPTIYINGLIGAPNNPGPLDEARTINRQIFNKAWLFGQLDELSSPMRRVLDGVIALLKRRASEEAFNPGGPPLRPVYLGSSSVISAILESPNGKERILGAVNVSAKKQKLEISSQVASAKSLHDIISGIKYTTKDRPLTISLEPYQVVWLKSVFKKI